MESIAGQTVSHYALLEKLGEGGMGEIYKARDLRLNRVVAVKVLNAGRTRDPERRRRFIQEARAASALNHPNIVTVNDILAEGDTQYMVMEYVAGRTLQALIASGRLSAGHILQVSAQIASALSAAHAAGIIHRDLKPANVMITESGLVKVLDFGLAKLTDTAGRSGVPASGLNDATLTAAPLTVEGTIMGTLNYMSPEQAEGLKVDARSDIFSFGAVLYEMATGRKAFDGDSALSTLSAVLRDEPIPILRLAPDVPVELDDLIVRCLRKKPMERWQSMNDVAAALRSMRMRFDSAPAPVRPVAASPTPQPTPEPPPVYESSKAQAMKFLSLGAGSAMVVALIVGAIWWQTNRPAARVSPPQAATSVPAPVSDSQPPPVPPRKASEPTTASQPATVASTSAAGTAAPAAPTPPETEPAAVPVTLKDGLPIRIALLEDVPADAQVGRPLQFRVLDDVMSGTAVAIAKGATVTGAVAAVGGKRNFFGERSKVKFSLTSVQSVSDTKIDVRATPSHKGDSDDSRPLEAGKGPLKDKNLIAASGAEYVAYVAGDQTVNVRK